jgi:hypothetical protein
MGDQWMNDCVVTYVESDIFKTINDEEIMQWFQNMKTYQEQLNKLINFCSTLFLNLDSLEQNFWLSHWLGLRDKTQAHAEKLVAMS